MRIRWNTYEPPVPVDLGFDPEDGLLVEVYNAEGDLCTVTKTQITGARERTEDINRVYIWVDGDYNEDDSLVNTYEQVSNFLIQARSANNRPITILSHELKGRTFRIKVQSCKQA